MEGDLLVMISWLQGKECDSTCG